MEMKLTSLLYKERNVMEILFILIDKSIYVEDECLCDMSVGRELYWPWNL